MYWQSLWLRAPRLAPQSRAFWRAISQALQNRRAKNEKCQSFFGSDKEASYGDRPMPIELGKTTPQQGTAAAMRERRAKEAAQAIRDYEANRIAVRAKTERLRAARLAKEASDRPAKKAR
jgi:hypothetical protein